MDYSLKNWLTKAKQNKFAFGAFNAANLELVKAIVDAAAAAQSPVIIEASQGEIDYFGLANFLSVVKNYQKEIGLPLFTNLDHGKDIEKVQSAIEAGFDMVHFDGSDLPFEENLKATSQIISEGHKRGVLVEVEFEKIQGASQSYAEQTAESAQVSGQYTDPQKARQIVSQLHPDLLAVSIGNLHGVYQTEEKIDLGRLEKISSQVNCFLSLHGGSGINPSQIQQAIGLGIVKININTDLRLAYRQTLENVLKGSDEVKIYQLMPPVIAAVQDIVGEKISLFGSQGQASEKANIAQV